MANSFDIRVETLGQPVESLVAPPVAAPEALLRHSNVTRGTFFLETFGCQMNEHDSEKVAGLLLARGYRQVETPEAAGLILYNTCSFAVGRIPGPKR
jgi:hypothetical protein